MTFADAMLRFAEDRLITGDELRQLFRGIGIDPSERPEPTQIVEAMDLDCIPLAAARLAAKADGTVDTCEWVQRALFIIDEARDHNLLPWSQGLPLPIELRKAAVGMGILADAAVGLIRNRIMEPLVPYPPQNITAEELAAAVERGFNDAAGRPDAGADSRALPADSGGVE